MRGFIAWLLTGYPQVSFTVVDTMRLFGDKLLVRGVGVWISMSVIHILHRVVQLLLHYSCLVL